MSFPVPVAYELTDEKNETVVVYNDGREERLLPWLDGGEAQRNIKTLTFTTVEDHTVDNPLVFNLDPSDQCEILYYIEGEYTPQPNEIILGAIGVHKGTSTEPIKAGHMLRTTENSVYSGVNTSNAGTFAPETGEYVIPNVSGYKIPKDYTFRLMQIKTGVLR